MSRLLSDTRFPVRVWGGEVEAQAEQQLRNIATLPFLFHHVAVMPDVHWGVGATVGTVLASVDTVIPAAVGVDIGCGMMAVRLPCGREALERDGRLALLRRNIEREIPVGFHQHKPARLSAEARAWAAEHVRAAKLRHPVAPALLEKARLQLGTLGGGNHFIELCHDEQQQAWVLLHSGSRHIGKHLADQYIKLAKRTCQQRGTLSRLPDPNLAWLQRDDAAFDDYLADLYWAQAYARFNREEMMRRILRQLAGVLLGERSTAAGEALVAAAVNCHHNYVARERHYGRLVYVTRKGAVSARKGERGIIPGSMGVCSYIVEGTGNAESFHSCAHGAGRRMSRKEAQRRFSVQQLAAETAGVECRKDRGVLDEIPSAYKPIDEVMEAQAELVRIRHRLKQLVCVKG